MTLTVIDGRYARFRVLPETQALDYANDVSALSAEAHSALCDGRVMKVSDALFAIHGIAREWSGAVEEAPLLTPGQLDLALCGEGAVGPGHGHAA